MAEKQGWECKLYYGASAGQDETESFPELSALTLVPKVREKAPDPAVEEVDITNTDDLGFENWRPGNLSLPLTFDMLSDMAGDVWKALHTIFLKKQFCYFAILDDLTTEGLSPNGYIFRASIKSFKHGMPLKGAATTSIEIKAKGAWKAVVAGVVTAIGDL